MPIERVDRPGESQEATGREKKAVRGAVHHNAKNIFQI